MLDDLVRRGTPDRPPRSSSWTAGAGAERFLAALWSETPVQHCAVHKRRNLLAHAPDHLREETTADYTDIVSMPRPKPQVEAKHKAFIRNGG